MELKSLKCPVCGASVDVNKIDFTRKIAKCSSCDETFVIEQAESFAKVEVDKSKDIKNYRTNLSVAVEKNNIKEIKRLAENILDILPDDYEGGYFYAYALSKLGDSSYLYDFYKDTEKVYTEESATRVAEHVIANGELRDDGLIKEFLSNLEYNPQEFLKLYKETFEQRVNKEELYDDITRDVFICHRSTDGEIANGIVKLLEDDGNKCWISSRNLRPNDNDNYWDNIKKAIKSCRIFLVVSSRSAMMSTDVKKELAYAKDLNKRRLEVKIDDSEHTAFFKDFFDGYKWIKGENHDEIKSRVADLLAKELSGKDKVVVHKVQKIDFTPIKAAKPVEKKIINDLHEHKYVKAEVVPPTCKDSGYTIYRCECGAEKKGDFTPKRTEHDFREAERKLPTCTENGYVKYECVYCDQIKKDVLPATGHKYELFDKKVPTCINEGHDIYKCSICGDTDVKTLPKTPHTYGDWKVAKHPTCIKEGEEVRQCSFCSKTETRPIPANGHNFGKWVVKTEPTCDKKGIEHRQCKNCGKIEERSLPKRKHKYSAWQNSKDGKYKERICEHCSHVEKLLTEDYIRQRNKKRAKTLEIATYLFFAIACVLMFAQIYVAYAVSSLLGIVTIVLSLKFKYKNSLASFSLSFVILNVFLGLIDVQGSIIVVITMSIITAIFLTVLSVVIKDKNSDFLKITLITASSFAGVYFIETLVIFANNLTNEIAAEIIGTTILCTMIIYGYIFYRRAEVDSPINAILYSVILLLLALLPTSIILLLIVVEFIIIGILLSIYTYQDDQWDYLVVVTETIVMVMVFLLKLAKLIGAIP